MVGGTVGSTTLVAALVTLALTSAACEQPEPLLRVGTNVFPGYEGLYLARADGKLPPEQVRLVEYVSASQVLRAFRSGAIEAAALTLDECLLLREEVPDTRIVAVLDVSMGADAVVGRPGVGTLSELAGKRVGVEDGALGAFMLLRALDHAGLPIDAVQLVPLPADRQEAAFLRGEVDAVVTFEPTKGRLLAEGGTSLFDSAQIPGEVVDVLVVRSGLVDRAPLALQLLLGGLDHGAKLFSQDPAGASRRAAPRLGLTGSQATSAAVGLEFPGLAGSRRLLEGTPSQLERQAGELSGLMRERGLLSGRAVTEPLVDPRPLAAAPR